MQRFSPFIFLCLFALAGCVKNDADTITGEGNGFLFTKMPPTVTAVDFANNVEYTEEFNVYTYRNFYNGGGVGLGDFNNDGLLDIYFCGNQVDNRLYVNQGDFKFEDITSTAGVASAGVWSTGVSIADVNGDGWLDIYVCKSGDLKGENRHNELFINNGDLTFTEKAKEYGIADRGLSTHAAFFDYDKDGDLDCYLLNNSFRSVGGYDMRRGLREVRDSLGANKLYRNDGDRFVDVSAEAGIYGSAIGFGLGVTVGDINKDGWQDIFVANDFFERDYLYINNQNGTFSEQLELQMPEISMGSMGADMADIDNDGYPDLYVTEMLPNDDRRLKTKAQFENWDKYQLAVQSGYHKQFSRNVLHLNNRNGKFSEISRMSGIHATDWSWGALIMDMDNDGNKDIFIANGIYKDLLDQDYINYFADPATIRQILTKENQVIKQLVDSIPSEKLANYAFKNNGNYSFTDMAAEWGLGEPGHSNGSAYGDLDNDGDLDLVINNVNESAWLFRNESNASEQKNNFLSVTLKGKEGNPFAVGAQLTLKAGNTIFFQEIIPTRGFESSVDHRAHFGLGDVNKIDSLFIVWPDLTETVLTDIEVNEFLVIDQGKSQVLDHKRTSPRLDNDNKLFERLSQGVGLTFRHQENNFVDFDRDRLLFHMLSNESPCLCKGDINGDGKEDIFVGNSRDASGKLFVQNSQGKFQPLLQEDIENDRSSEDTDCTLFDADNDGDLDLYVASGGNEFPRGTMSLADRLYLNNGKGTFIKSKPAIPILILENSATVQAADYDKDGDVDLFVGTRVNAGSYGTPTNSYILSNDGYGIFEDVTRRVAPELVESGMVTDAKWLDYDADGDQDLVVIGEWMGIRIFRNNAGVLEEVSPQQTNLDSTEGFWNTIEVADINGDGYPDMIAGNHGLNSRLKASKEKPLSMIVGDFDRNGTIEQVISAYNGDKSYPLVLRNDLVMQMPGYKKKYLKYGNYKEQTVEDIFDTEQLDRALSLNVYQTRTTYFENKGDGTFDNKPLPIQAQMAPVYAIEINDFDKDGNLDVILGGNLSKSKPEMGIYMSSYGLALKGDGQGGFESLPASESGLSVEGEIRAIEEMTVGNIQLLVIARNSDDIEIYEINKK
ncbi:MAG: VCBS repeat-containing protein [Bacteroidota bacterium]